MFNIWYLLLCTINISLVALLILLLKYLFKDLLSARWQYGIWAVLILRMVLPSGSSRNIFLPLGKYIEMLKFAVEDSINSAYTDVYSLIRPGSPLPDSLMPVSVTDWIFAFYILGVAVSGLYYIASYIKLRTLLKKGTLVPDEVRRKIELFAGIYSLRVPGRIVYIKGLPSAFICGVIKPVLALPEEKPTDEKIILHELLHYKHKDTLKSLLRCVLRCFNWFNPLMHYVFERIGNDVEALCDLRTLEKLEGEDRREYGKLLLSMVNERYQKVPCTSSLSNGGKNIARRIDSIVKFKKYPKGMGLVSVCIVIMLCLPCLYGSAAAIEQYYPETEAQLSLAIASARSVRCTTMAGAIDAYAKGLRGKNGIMLLAAVPESRHKDIIAEMKKNSADDDKDLFYYESGEIFNYIDPYANYLVYSPVKLGENSYRCYLAFKLESDSRQDIKKFYPEAEFIKTGDEYYADFVLPLIVEKYGNRWLVTGEEIRFVTRDIESDINAIEDIVFTVKGENGTVDYRYLEIYKLNSFNNEVNFGFSYDVGYSAEPEINSDFDTVSYYNDIVYTANEEIRKNAHGKSFILNWKRYETLEAYENSDGSFEKSVTADGIGSMSSSSGEGASYNDSLPKDWDGIKQASSGGGFSDGGIKVEDYGPPEVIKIRAKLDGKLIDEIVIYPKEDKHYDS